MNTHRQTTLHGVYSTTGSACLKVACRISKALNNIELEIGLLDGDHDTSMTFALDAETLAALGLDFIMQAAPLHPKMLTHAFDAELDTLAMVVGEDD